jgi:hypothetical protein
MIHGRARWWLGLLAIGVAVGVLPGVFVSRASAQQPAESPEQRLIEKFAPVVALKTQASHCDSNGEPYLPVPVDIVFNDPAVLLKRAGANGAPDAVIKAAPSAADLFGLGGDYYLDLPGKPRTAGCGYEAWARARMPGLAPTTYAHIVSADGHLALQYWFYYVFNDFNNKHESDWEMMQLVFDVPTAAAATSVEPVSVVLAQHGGGETTNWDDTKLGRQGDHPVVFVSAGSHATQYRPGTYLGWGERGTGFGCDVATGPSTFIALNPVLLPETVTDPASPFAWLSFRGLWGERAGGEYDGPGGPATKSQWAAPFAWQARQRDSSLKIPESRTLGPGPTQVFCSVTTYGSNLFTRLGTDPRGVAIEVIAILAALGGLFFITRSTIREAAALYVRHWRTFVLIGLILVPVGIAFNGFQYLVSSYPPGEQVVELLNEHHHDGSFAAALVVGVFQQLAGIILVGPAVIEAFRRTEQGRPLGVVSIYRESVRKFPETARAVLLAGAAVVPLTLFVVTSPVAIWLLVRWLFVPQAVILDDERGRRALHRSGSAAGASLHWLRTAGSGLLLFAIGAAPGPLIGIAFLVFRSSSVDFANTVSSVFFAALLPFSFLGFTVLYRERERRQAALRAAASAPPPAGAPELPHPAPRVGGA